MLVNNAGFNCRRPRVVVTVARLAAARGVPQRDRDALATIPTRRAYYPGAFDRHAAFVRAHPESTSSATRSRAPAWTVMRDLDSDDGETLALNVEAFCSLMAETALDTATPDQFVDAAVEFCNDTVWGSLSATILAHPRDPEITRGRRAGRRAALRCGAQPVARPFAFGRRPGAPIPGTRSPTSSRGPASSATPSCSPTREVRRARTISLPAAASLVLRPHQLRTNTARARLPLGKPIVRSR